MKMLITTLSFMLSVSAFANSFDRFIGKYKVVGAPAIQKQNAKSCNRFFFKDITGLEIKADTSGFKQSHVLFILNPSGWSAHPVADYYEKTDTNPSRGTYANTTGSGDMASNDWGSFGREDNERLVVTIKKSGNEFVFSMAEELVLQGTVTAACYYQVQMQK